MKPHLSPEAQERQEKRHRRASSLLRGACVPQGMIWRYLIVGYTSSETNTPQHYETVMGQMICKTIGDFLRQYPHVEIYDLDEGGITP